MRTATLLCTTAFVALGAANAQAANGWYVGLEAGWNWIGENDALFTATRFGGEGGEGTTFFSDRLGIEFDDGWAILGTAGYSWGNWRVEGELGYRDNDIGGDGFKFTRRINPLIVLPLPPTTLTSRFVSAELSQTSLMANVLYDIYMGSRFKLTLGAGIGGNYVSFDDNFAISDNSWGFAYQGIVGLGYAITPRTDLFLNYRYMVTEGSDYGGALPDIFPGGLFNARFDNGDYDNQTLTIGFRYDLQPDMLPAPPPPPPPPPLPPEPAPAPRQFLVFFGFNKSNLTAEAQSVVQQAAQAAKEYGAATITVVGHADTVGSPGYNQRLSERRAGAVRSALVSSGIDAGKISASGRGETELLVQTGDGVKEPQNRRATIDM